MDAERTLIKTTVTATLAAALLVAAGCSNTAPTGPTTLSAWEGTLAPVLSTSPDSTLVLITGNIAALVREAGTEVGIGLQAFEDPDLVMDWGLYTGLCDVPGDLLGARTDYPQVDQSQLDATAILEEKLVEGDTYYVSVTDASTGQELACGNLSQTEL